MKITFKTKYEGAIAAFGTRAINDVLREAFWKAGDYWGRYFRQKHFTRAGAAEYGYKPRKNQRLRAGSKQFRRYAGPAEKQAGEILPLVHSGELRREASTYRVRAKATSKRVYAQITLPRAMKLNLLPAEFRGEMHVVSDREWQVLVSLINREVLRGLRQLRRTRTTKIG